MSNKETFTTPKCVVEWAHLQEPQPAQGKFKESYKITAVLDASNEEHKKLLGKIKELGLHKNNKLKTGESKFPIKYHVDEEGEKSGLFAVSFKTAYGPVKTFDAGANLMLKEKNFVANGSECKISWGFDFYDEGVSLYLNAVQIINLIEWQGGTADDFGFGVEEAAPEDFKDKEPTPQQAEPGEQEEEDDLLF